MLSPPKFSFKVHFNTPPIVVYLDDILLSGKMPPFSLFIANLCILNNHSLFYKLIIQIKFKIFKNKLKELDYSNSYYGLSYPI